MRLMTTFGLLALLASSAPARAQDDAGGEGLELDDRSAGVAEGEIIPEASGSKGDSIYSDLLGVRDLPPPLGTPVLAARLFPTDRRLEFQAGFEMSVIDKYVEHMGGRLNLGYHLSELMVARLTVGYLNGSARNLYRAAEEKGGQTNTCQTQEGANYLKGCLPDTTIMSWFVGPEIVFEPFYGKLNLVSEFALNFDIYFGIGAGVFGQGGISPNIQVSPISMVNDSERQGIGVYGTAVAGFRIWAFENLGLVVEARDISYKGDRDYLELNQTSGQQGDLVNTWTMLFGFGYLN